MLKKTWKNQVMEKNVKGHLGREDTLCSSKWSVGINKIDASLRKIRPPSLVVETTRFYSMVSLEY